MSKSLYEALGCKTRESQKKLAKKFKTTTKVLDYYDKNHILPSHDLLQIMEENIGVSKVFLMLSMGIYSSELIDAISKDAERLAIDLQEKPSKEGKLRNPDFCTDYGKLYNIDCLQLLKGLANSSVDLVFADPPFNLDKFYKSNINDNLHQNDYLKWCLKWIDECIRILKPGGSLLIWNLPKWNSKYANYLHERLTFKNWIAVDMKNGLPIANRLYPAHYSLLYFVKGEKANTFKPDRMPMETCPKCLGDLKDYGGYKNKMNPKGVNMTDVWYDIPPVRHSKYKRRIEANELSIKLLDRILEMTTEPNDVVFDPFGGSGTTFVVAEIKKRRWIGSELDPLDTIIERFTNIDEERKFLDDIRQNYNYLFPPIIKNLRKKRGLWTDESFN